MDSDRQGFIAEVQSLIFNDQFRQADSVCLARMSATPTDPTPFLFRATVLIARMSAYEDGSDGPVMKRMLDSVEALTESWLDTCSANTGAWMYLYRGHTRAYRALWESRFGGFISAVRIGLSSPDEYEKGLALDSQVTDLYAGLGAFHYWKSAKAGFLRWLGIFKNEKEKGLRELYRAANSSLVHRQSARSSLIWIWLDKEEYDSVITIAREFIGEYPQSTTFRWPLAQAFYDQNLYDSASVVFEQIRSLLLNNPGNYFNLIECDYNLARCYTWLENDAGLDSTLARFREYSDSIPDKIRKKQRSALLYLERLMER